MKKFLLSLLFSLCIMTTQAQYLLDQIGTSPSVAFSLRLLKSTYSGPLVRIYVGTSYYDVYPDATTKNFSLSSKISAAIGSSSAAVAVASTIALSSIITAGTTNATVAIWYDQSGNNKYVHTSSTTGAPRIITAGSIRLMNGQPTINFIGAQTSPTPRALISVNTVNYSSQQTATVNAVVQNIGSTSVISGIYSTGKVGGWGLNYDQTNGYWLDGSGCNHATTGAPSTTAKIVTGFLNKSNSTSIIYENSVQKGSMTIRAGCPPTNGTSDKIAIGIRAEDGGNRMFDGNISEVILYPAVLSATDQSTLESSQNAAYFGPSVTIASSASGAVCAGTSVTFTATTYNFSGTPTYQWYKNSVAINGETNATYTTTSLSNNDQIKVICNNPPSIVNDNSLQLWLDAGNSASYSSGTTWSDLSGNGRNATLNNGASFDATSKSIVTNGVDQYVSVPLFNNSITNTTMQTWVYINANSKGAFISNGTSSYSIGIGSSVSGEMSNNGNRAWMLFSSVRYIDTNTDYPSGWHLVTMTMDANAKPSYYLDGSFVYTSPSGSNPNTVSDSFNLGAVPGDGGKYYNGKFAAAYFYNRVLTASEISQNYSATVGSIGGGSGGGVTSNTITVSVSPAPSANITVSGDSCINKTTLSTPTGQTSYLWYKDNAPISGATSNTYSPTTAGDYKVQVTSGSCSTMSAVTTIAVCGVTADGRMRSIATPTTLVSQEGGVNFGTGVSEAGATVNATGIGTTLGTVGATTAVVSGVISSTNALTSSIGVIYSTDSNFGTFSTSSTQSNVASGTHVFTLSGLASTTPYYAKSFIVNKAGTSYGAVVSFTTLAEVPPTKVAITRASVGTGYGLAFTTQPQVTIQDVSGNTVTTSSAVVTATISSGGTLVGTTTATASSGVATFSNLGIKGTATAYTITYTVLALTPASQSVTPTALSIGATGPGGGKVFYASSSSGFTCGPTLTERCYYLEVAPIGANTLKDWAVSANRTSSAGASGTAIGSGYQNTERIVAQGNSGSAAAYARAYRGGGLSDWYLGSTLEMYQIYVNSATIITGTAAEHGFAGEYWTSTEPNASQAYSYDVTNNSGPWPNAKTSNPVRPIRSF